MFALQRRFPGAELAFETCSSRRLYAPFFQLVHLEMRRLPRWPIFHRGQWAVRYRLDAPSAP